MKENDSIYIDKLLSYYSEENLTIISTKIIEAYKNKKYSFIIGLCNLVDNSFVKNANNIQKVFSYLLMLYHPDRLNLYKNEIINLKKINKLDEIKKHNHIITVTENIDKIQYNQNHKKIDFDIEYDYGYDDEDFDSVINTDEIENYYEDLPINNSEIDFISLLRYKEFGNLEEELPSYYLEYLEGELNLSNSNLYDLAGLENCINISELDLSGNKIIDIVQIGFLTKLLDLNLSGNAIQSIGVLYNLKKLKKLDISFNTVDNILPILNLPNLEYVNIIGNVIPENQIELIKKKNIILVC